MNTGIGNAHDIAWKLAAVAKGYDDPGLLASYEQERRRVAAKNVDRAAGHMAIHLGAVELPGASCSEVNNSPERRLLLRKALHSDQRLGVENTEIRIEVGYRYVSDVCIPDDADSEPKWDPHTFLPTTWPGSRAPHVLLKDGKSIFDLLGSDFALVEFRDRHGQQTGRDFMATAAMGPGVPLVPVTIVGGTEAVSICEKNLGLVRSDGHAAWTGASVKDQGEADRILETVLGCRP